MCRSIAQPPTRHHGNANLFPAITSSEFCSSRAEQLSSTREGPPGAVCGAAALTPFRSQASRPNQQRFGCRAITLAGGARLSRREQACFRLLAQQVSSPSGSRRRRDGRAAHISWGSAQLYEKRDACGNRRGTRTAAQRSDNGIAPKMHIISTLSDLSLRPPIPPMFGQSSLLFRRFIAVTTSPHCAAMASPQPTPQHQGRCTKVQLILLVTLFLRAVSQRSGCDLRRSSRAVPCRRQHDLRPRCGQ